MLNFKVYISKQISKFVEKIIVNQSNISTSKSIIKIIVKSKYFIVFKYNKSTSNNRNKANNILIKTLDKLWSLLELSNKVSRS